MKNKLREFYETTDRKEPFNSLSFESLNILEKSKAYRSYCKPKTNWFKYAGNVLLCAFMAILIVMLFLNEVLKQM